MDSDAGTTKPEIAVSQPARCSVRGCKATRPDDLEKEGVCVPHFLEAAENDCATLRREAIPGTGLEPYRRTEIENYIAASAVKLVALGTGTVRLSDETKKRILTVFLSLMILRETLDRTTPSFQPRRKLPKPVPALEPVAAAS